MACPSRKRSGRAFAFMRSSLRSAHIGSKSPPFGGGREGLHAPMQLFYTHFNDFSPQNFFFTHISDKNYPKFTLNIK
jgi:hypothetical protein